MYSVGVKKTVQVSHWLVGVEDPKEEQLHGHSYTIHLELSGDTLDQRQFLLDITVLEGFLLDMAQVLASKPLNEMEYFSGANPSVEKTAHFIASLWKDHAHQQGIDALAGRVSVWENEDAYAAYSWE